ncbi:hypothetical protein DY124_05375 [Apilactobacillus micheneri]|uniref:MFS transporter n=1 Tax=Apilactobacillus micheneri TaxID=1899430 RepID=UPI0011282346|nr:MFS transporter [Apilactobacillus micheneri]TPR43588.1 hypothetical protein DY124_05375 [Apilactobacillus micheneri]TPR47538.1 hypothetical protein DY125_05375 [Apilactobacillus micheneri]
MWKALSDLLKEILRNISFLKTLTIFCVPSLLYFAILTFLPNKSTINLHIISLKNSISISFMILIFSFCAILITISIDTINKIKIKHRNKIKNKKELEQNNNLINDIKNDKESMEVLRSINKHANRNVPYYKSRSNFECSIISLCEELNLVEPFTIRDRIYEDTRTSKYKLTDNGKKLIKRK